MKSLLKRYIPELLLPVILGILYLPLRLFHLLNLPLFTDEAIYTRWSQIAAQDASWRFISLTDGKQPMYVWWDMTFMRFIHDPLLAGRLVSVAAGALSMVGLFFLGKELFKNKWVGILTAAAYVLYPFALVYDRMALYDTMVGMFAIWSLYLSIKLVRTPKAWIAFTLALVMGGGMLTKTSDFFSMYLLPVTLLLFDWREKDRTERLVTWVFFAVLTVGLANLYYSVLRLSPFFHVISDKNAIFVYPLKEWLQHPWTFLIGNLHGLWSWFITYVGWYAFLLMVASFLLAREYTKEKLLIIIYFIVPFFLLALFGKVLYPRFILFMTLPLLCLVALSLYKTFSIKAYWYLPAALCLLLFFFWGKADAAILTNFARAPIADSDLAQYANSWPAGGGMREIVNFLAEKANSRDIYVLSDGTFGSLPTYSVEIYLGKNPHIQKRGIYPIPDEIPSDIVEKAKQMPVYVIFNERQAPPPSWPVKLLVTYQKGIGTDHASLYEVEVKK